MSSCVGTDSSARLALCEGRKHGLLPCAGAATKLSNVSNNETMDGAKLFPEAITGEAFCFLPLSIATGLPVHINGYFAITSNRRNIWERSTADQGQPIEVQWNECLMDDALSNAYIQLLETIKHLHEEKSLQRYNFHALWPCYSTLKSSTWGPLVKSVYSKLVKECLPLLWSNEKWLDIHSGYILDKDLRETPGALKTLNYLKVNVFDLTEEICSTLAKSGEEETLKKRTLTLENFLKEFFFPNISKVPQKLRDPIVCFGLDCILNQRKEFVPLFKDNACIRCSVDGVHLSKPCKLINPAGAAAKLFLLEDNRFPVGKSLVTSDRIYVLEQLEMVKDLLSWEEICERVKSVEELGEVCYERGLERSRNLIKYLKENIEKLGNAEVEHLRILHSTKFMPLYWKPPTEYTLPWKGSMYPEKQFFSPKHLFLPKDMHLVGSSCLIVDSTDFSGCGKLDERVETLLGFGQRPPNNDQVLKQLDFVINEDAGDSLKELVCNRVYKHFNGFVNANVDNPLGILSVKKLIKKLRGMSWLFIEGRFVSIEKVAFDWKGNGGPYLYGLSIEYRLNYDKLLRESGIKQVFEARDFINALNMLTKSKKGASLGEDEIKLTVSFVNELEDVKDVDVKAHIGKIPLPDAKGVLCKSEDLTINETFWLKDRGDARYVHKHITPSLALALGAKLLQERRRGKYAGTFGMSFGQHEKLTDRLKNILKSYPCDSGILKELVQNADDAKATEIHFVYDARTLPHTRVFQDNAKEIQGPALCVYNDRYFSEEDLKGIQNLGTGSKRDDPEKTGQYGVGFNAVYHLTDCPSFLSNGNTLCFLDPHCWYAHEATSQAPGVKFDAIDDAFKEDFSDSVSGYLGEHFSLIGSTMFRLPLRTSKQSQISQISNEFVNDSKIRHLLFDIFKPEAKKMLLFLNHVKKITLSVIDKKGKFKKEYEVKSIVDEENEKNRQEIALYAREQKGRPTREVPWKGTTYPVSLTDSEGLDEQWLIHQCFGVKHQTDDGDIPDGQEKGLSPRGGVAALVSSSSSTQQQYVAYCFLPLPVTTSLPVHVNGHFALDHSRRGLWEDKVEHVHEITCFSRWVCSPN